MFENLKVEEVAYVDSQRNVAVTFGERDVKADVKAKNRYTFCFLVKKPKFFVFKKRALHCVSIDRLWGQP